MLNKQTLFALIALILVTSNSCSRHKTLPVNQRCDNDIEQVSKILKEKSNRLGKDNTQRIQNLIKAAKIQQQHARFNTCVDKMNRALTLMKEDAASKQQTKTPN